VGDGDDGALVLVQELFEPQDRLGIQVVGRLVEQQQVGRFEQQFAQRHATALAARALDDRGIRVGALQRVHRLLKLRVEIPAVGRVDLGLQCAHFLHQRIEVGVRVAHLLADLVEARDLVVDAAEGRLDVLADGFRVIQRRLLLQDADRISGRDVGFAVRHGFEPGHDLEQRRLAHAVGPDYANFGPGQKVQGHVVENHAVAVCLARVDHLKYKFSQAASYPS
jgi:hypothetical protein